MNDTKYYDGTKLLSLLDLDKKKPEIYIVTTNRTGGKTTFFGRLLVRRWEKDRKKFCLIFRYSYELEDIPDKFFKDISDLFFPEYVMTAEKRAKGAFVELYINEEPCGYAVALNNADMVKKYSHLLSDVDSMLMDEFQSETGKYCPKEIRKFISIHTSVARGQGKQVRYVPVYMLSNTVSLINPYYTELGISNRLQTNTRFLRGHGYVLEQGFVESASNAQLESGFNRAFANNEYIGYSAQNVYLNDSTAFIARPEGVSRPIVNLKYLNQVYGLKEYSALGIIYCDTKPDQTLRDNIVVTTEDHSINYVMLQRNDFLLTNLRTLFEHGCFRFQNLMCKEAVLKALSY